MLDEVESLVERFLLARYLYKVGNPALEDREYDNLLAEIERGVSVGIYTEAIEFINRTYDDDPVPYDLLLKYAIPIETTTSTGSDRSFLVEDKSMSIQKVDNMSDVFGFINSFRGERFALSIKMDGDNIKSELNNGELLLSLTRGRDSEGIEVTTSVKNLMPDNMLMKEHKVITGEVFVPERFLGHLKNTYDQNKYKTTRTAAMTMLRRPQDHKPEDLQLMEYVIFSCDGLAPTVSETYEQLSRLGFAVPPILTFEQDIPDTLEQFTPFFTELMERMYSLQTARGLPADGLVLEVDRFDVTSTVRNQYDSRQIAVKFGHWSSSIYTGIIKNIIMEQRKAYCCCKVEIEGVTTDDGCTATVINVYNPSHILDKNLWIGDEIQFERQSGTINVLVT